MALNGTAQILRQDQHRATILVTGSNVAESASVIVDPSFLTGWVGNQIGATGSWSPAGATGIIGGSTGLIAAELAIESINWSTTQPLTLSWVGASSVNICNLSGSGQMRIKRDYSAFAWNNVGVAGKTGQVSLTAATGYYTLLMTVLKQPLTGTYNSGATGFYSATGSTGPALSGSTGFSQQYSNL